MKQSIFYVLAMALLLASGSCDNADNERYGHSSSVFRSFVDIMERMDKDMAAMPSQHDADRDFAMMMRIHHQSAVDMANVELLQGSNATMKETAQKIISAQQAEIAQFDAYLKSGRLGTKTDSFAAEAARPMKGMDINMQSKQGDVDVAFATMMIPHHQGAIRMATIYLKYVSDPQLKETGTAIIATQQREIQAFQRWLQKHDEHGV